MTTRIWLIRHGEPEQAVRGRCYGSLDVGLSERGRAGISRVADYLKDEGIAAVFASPLRRTLETGQAIGAACGCPCEAVDGFREIDFGDFEGMTYDEIAARYPEAYKLWMEQPARIHFPNGESLPAMRVRVLRAFEEVLDRTSGRSIAIASHGGVIRIVIAWALQIPDECFFRIGQQYAALNLLTLNEGVPSVELLNSACGAEPRLPLAGRPAAKARGRLPDRSQTF